MEDNRYLKVVNNDGVEILYEILMTFYLKESGKDYVVYTDIDNIDLEDINIYVSVYDVDKNIILEETINDDEWKYIEEIINSF